MRQERRFNWSLLLVCLAGCVVLGGVGASVVVADGTYDLSIQEDTVDTPPRTVENPFDDRITDEIDAFAVREPGEPIDVRVTAPDGESFYVDLYNSERDPEVRGPAGEGSEMVTFDSDDTQDIEPGTYSLGLYADSNYQAFHPVVISGYEISYDTPNVEDGKARMDETIEFEIAVTPTELSSDPAGVEVVIWNDDHTADPIEATGSGGSYSASVDLDGFEPGEYTVYVAALGDDEFRGQPEILGLSEQQMIEVVEGDSERDSENDGDGDGGGGASPGGGGQPVSNDGDEEPVEDNESDFDDEGNETDATPTEPTETVELVDESPDERGVQVSFENAIARAVTLSNESASGNVTVTDRSEPPADSSPPAGSPIATVEIAVPESERDAPATIELVVDADAVTDTERLAVEKYHAENDTWTRLESTVTETSETTITLTAETPGFSIFAVTETSDSTDSTGGENGADASASNGTDGSTSNSSDGSVITPSEPSGEPAEDERPEDQPGFGFIPATVALLLAAMGIRSVGGRNGRNQS